MIRRSRYGMYGPTSVCIRWCVYLYLQFIALPFIKPTDNIELEGRTRRMGARPRVPPQRPTPVFCSRRRLDPDMGPQDRAMYAQARNWRTLHVVVGVVSANDGGRRHGGCERRARVGRAARFGACPTSERHRVWLLGLCASLRTLI